MSSPRTLAEILLSASQLMAIAEAVIRKVEEGACERAGVDVWVLRWRVGELNRSRTLARRSSFAPRQRHSERLPASLEINNSIEAATFGQLVRRYLQEAIPERQFTAAPLHVEDRRIAQIEAVILKVYGRFCGQERAGLDDDGEEMAESESVEIPHEYWRFLVFHRIYP